MAEEGERPVDRFDEIVDSLVESFPYMLNIASKMPDFERSQVVTVTVPTEDGEEKLDFDREEWNKLVKHFIQSLKVLPRIRIPPRSGAPHAPPPQIIYLGKELRTFIKNNRPQFMIHEEYTDENGNKKERTRDPFADGLLDDMLKGGPTLQSTVASLLRAYNANNELWRLASYNKKAEKKGTKVNKGIVGADENMRKDLKGIFERLGPYYLETRPAREEKKARKGKPTKRPTARPPPTETEANEGFDIDQFPFGSGLQSIIKLGRKRAEEEKDEALNNWGAPDILTPEETKTLENLKKKREEDPEYVRLQEADAATKKSKAEEEGEEDEE